MPYIITNPQENLFIHKNKNQSLSVTSSKQQAYNWNTFDKANNVLEHLPPSILINSSSWKITCTSSEKNTSMTSSLNSNLQTNQNLREEISKLKSSLQQELEQVREQLSQYDKEKEDVLHYIEFANLNAYQGYKVYNLLHEIMQDRRTAKDRILYLQILINKLSDTPLPPKERQYTPRALPTLFTQGI